MNELDEESLGEYLGSFSCPKNEDVETFIRRKAIRFERSHNSRTYLITSSLSSELLGYFSLTFKEIHLNPAVKISKSKIQDMDGLSKNAETIRAFLIAQIGKNDSVDDNPVTLALILERACSCLLDAWRSIGGRVVLIECSDNPKLKKLYQDHQFREIQIDNGLVQMWRRFDPQVVSS